ncbi:ATP-NAD kinase family protein [candidate division KSB1 bacterium]|nr:ATP-NAD kinase family protein [candidate division KSB1 bacterium]MBL7103501.1 ATP-NAD kinase family protein [Bacteroidales bacterium]
MKKIGLIVNPIAGMGGSVGLKGTDGEIYKKAIELGAKPTTPQRIEETLSLIKREDIHFMVAPGKMGENSIGKFDFKYEIVSTINEETNASDTKRIVKKMLEKNIELLIFVGGDGTARDIYDAVGLNIPVIGIPSGVKMFSPVFALSPNAAAQMINNYTKELTEKEVLDIDEEAFRENKISAKLYGYLKVPKNITLLQAKKEPSNVSRSEEDMKEEIADYLMENLEKETLYILGPGTTLKTIADKMGVEKTLLGIDAVFNGELVGIDLNEKGLLTLIKMYNKSTIIVTPIGGNGFIFGRASKQFTPEVLKLIGKKNIVVVATEDKINKLECLRLDTGNIEVDKSLSGFTKVITAYKKETIIEVK